MEQQKPTPPVEAEKKLGTFGGVFTPSILTILGIILFMRLGFVVGDAGLKRALMMILVANAISLLTSFSLSAIATNLRVKGGGDYYLISRTLGVSFGGAIGLVLFMAQSVSIAFYCIGFGEAVAAMFQGGGDYLPQLIAAGAAALLFVFAWLGADWATKLQYFIMAALCASLISFFVGGFGEFDTANLARNWAERGGDTPFWILFAIFFPAVTGFTQGVSMSGDLKDPGRSLPRGTFCAVGISIVVYLGAAVVFSGALPGNALASDYGAMKRVALVGWLIDVGVIAATLSSALASFLGAPRILQSLAKDKVFPFLNLFAQGAGPTENPRRAILLAGAIAFITIAAGGLDLVARLVSMFFLISYGLLNYATYFEAKTDSPSFRPRFKWYHPRISLLGGLACAAVMLAIDWIACLVALSLLVAVHQYLTRTAGPSRWADSQRSFHLQGVRRHLLEAAAVPAHPRNWRPQVLAFSRDPVRRKELLRFASWLQGKSGFTTAVQIIEGEGLKALKERERAAEELHREVAESGYEIFTRVVVAPDLETGVSSLIQASGIGPLRANTLLMNWLEPIRRNFFDGGAMRYGRNVREAFRLGCNIIVLDANEDEWKALDASPVKERRIDVWWTDDASSRLMLLLAYLLTRSEGWRDAELRVLTLRETAGCEAAEARMKEMLDEARIDATPRTVTEVSLEAMENESSDAALVLLPFRVKGNELVGPLGCKLDECFERLPIVAMVLAAENIDLDAEPEEGAAAEIAAANDAHSEAEKKAMKITREAGKAAEDAEKQRQALEEAVAANADSETIAKLRSEALAAQSEAIRLARRAARALTKADDARKHATDVETHIASLETATPETPKKDEAHDDPKPDAAKSDEPDADPDPGKE